MTQSKNHTLPPQYRLGSYRILSLLSSGGFSLVYLAQTPQNRLVAIKEYLPNKLAKREAGQIGFHILADQERAFRHGMRCFFEEGRALAGLYHSNVVRVLNFIQANDTVYLVLRYEAGRTLHDYVQHRTTHYAIREFFLRRTFYHLLNGIRQVHAHKLLHLDIKPSNIYLRRDGSPILMDFGSSRQMLTKTAPKLAPMYTPGYAAPEQHTADAKLGPWTDIYGIGATLYACIGLCSLPSAHKRLEKDELIPAVILFRGKYPVSLLELIDRCLQLDPLQRPQTGYELQKSMQFGMEPNDFVTTLPFNTRPTPFHHPPKPGTAFDQEAWQTGLPHHSAVSIGASARFIDQPDPKE